MVAKSTNGESAKKWLEENKEHITEQRIVQIRSSLEKKINQLITLVITLNPTAPSSNVIYCTKVV